MQQSISINDWRNLVMDTELPTSVKMVAMAIAKYWRQEKLCYPSINTLMSDSSLSKPSVISAIKALIEANFIRIKKGQIKYLSSLQNYYEFIGVDDSKVDSKNDGKVNGKNNGKNDGKVNGKAILPEISEIREVSEIRENNISSQDKSCSEIYTVPTCFVKQAERLAEIIKKQKNVKIDNRKIAAWAKSLSLLNKNDGVEVERIDKVLDWYGLHFGEDYIPVAESGQTLREKFLRIESAMSKTKKRYSANDADNAKWEKLFAKGDE